MVRPHFLLMLLCSETQGGEAALDVSRSRPTPLLLTSPSLIQVCKLTQCSKYGFPQQSPGTAETKLRSPALLEPLSYFSIPPASSDLWFSLAAAVDAAGCHGSKHPAKLKQRHGSSWPSENATGFRAKREAIGGSSAILKDSQPLSHPAAHTGAHMLSHTLLHSVLFLIPRKTG